jgi:predicted GIY-YIG superfamily endonuclease
MEWVYTVIRLPAKEERDKKRATPPPPPPKLTDPRWTVYRIYDVETDELLYVGMTSRMRLRKNEHHALGRYRRHRVRYEVDAPTGYVAAAGSESHQIKTLHPRDNQRMKGTGER